MQASGGYGIGTAEQAAEETASADSISADLTAQGSTGSTRGDILEAISRLREAGITPDVLFARMGSFFKTHVFRMKDGDTEETGSAGTAAEAGSDGSADDAGDGTEGAEAASGASSGGPAVFGIGYGANENPLEQAASDAQEKVTEAGEQVKEKAEEKAADGIRGFFTKLGNNIAEWFTGLF